MMSNPLACSPPALQRHDAACRYAGGGVQQSYLPELASSPYVSFGLQAKSLRPASVADCAQSLKKALLRFQWRPIG